MTTNPELPYVVNPEAIGDPDQTPIVKLPSDMVAAMRAAGFICACGGMNGYHQDDCEAAHGDGDLEDGP